MDNQGPNNYNYNNGPGNNGSGGNGNNGGNRSGGNGGRNNRGGQGIMAFILLTLVALFVYALISNSISHASTQEKSYSDFIKQLDKGNVKSVEFDSYEIDYKLVDDGHKNYDITYYTGRVADDELVPTLKKAKTSEGKSIEIKAAIPDNTSTWIFNILSFIVPLILLWVLLAFVSKKMGGSMGMGVGKSTAKVYVEKSTGVTFKDVAGQDEAKESLQEVVDFLHNPKRYTDIGAKLPKGALLVGPPGTGKTLLAKAVAGEAGVPFFSLAGSDFVEMFVGVGASRVRDLFKEAQKMAPCIIFIDEIDAIGKSRDSRYGGGNDEREQTLNQLLAEMDGFDTSKGLLILAATNRPEVLDKALLRPGRFDRRIPVELPDLQGREEILKVHAKKIKIADSVRFDEIAKAAVGASGAELANIVNEAALRAVRDGRKFATQADFEESIEVVIAGYQKKNRVLSNKEKLIVSYHEVGHALVAAKQTDSAPVHKITIIPRTSGALGYTMQVDEQEHFLMSKEELENKIATFTGGRAAEELIFHSITTGASNDIEQATKIARAMISRYGMSDDFDMVAMENVSNQYLGGDASLTCSFETQTLLDKKVVELVRREHEKATKILTDNIGKLHEIAKYLYEHETITGEEFMKILNEKPDEIEEIQENETRQ